MITMHTRKNGEIWYCVAGVIDVRTIEEALALIAE